MSLYTAFTVERREGVKTGFDLWQRWLIIVGVIITLFGLLMAFLNGTIVFNVFDTSINSVFFGSQTTSEGVSMFQRWVFGAWGATVAGWGVFATFIARYPFKRRERWARDCLFSGLILWFVIDTGYSMFFAVWINVILNVVIFLLVIIPVIATWREFSVPSPPAE